MSKISRTILIVSLFLSLVIPVTPAGAEPSKEQTTDYILERIDDVNLRTSSMSIRTESKLIKLNVSHVQNAAIKDCVLTLTETKLENKDLVLEKSLSVPIAKLNPSNIKTSSNQLIIFTANDGLEVKLNARYRKDAKGKWTIDSREVDAISLSFSKGQAEKIARAFSHLIKLCGGQEDLF